MKFSKKLLVYIIVSMVCFGSISLSYEKAYNCEAAATTLYIGAAILAVAGLCYGAYYVSSPDARETLNETFTNYKNLSTEAAKNSYEFNKKLFNDFCTYAQNNGGGSASVYTASGQSFTVDQMQAEGFPDFTKWDDEMKKQSEKPKGSLWDALSFGLDLISFVSTFFRDDPNGYFPDETRKQVYFTGDDGYINRETGDVAINLYCDDNFVNPNNDDKYSPFFCKMFYHIEHRKNYGKDTTFRAAAFLGYYGAGNMITYPPSEGNSNDLSVYYRAKCKIFIYYGFSDKSPAFMELSGVTLDSYRIFYNGKDKAERQSLGDNRLSAFYSCNFKDKSDVFSYDLSDWDYLSTNVPVFLTREEAQNYITTGDYSGCLNLPPAVDTPTPKPDNDPEPTALDIYLNHYKSGGYTVDAVVNTNYNIANNWDGSTTNLTYILNGNVTPTPEPTNTPKPTKIAPSGDSNNYTNYNFFVDLSNFLQPIKDAIESILEFLLKIFDFFTIDIDAINIELNNANVLPTGQFTNFVDTFTNLKTTFSDDDQQSLAAVGSTQKGIDYPILKAKCPKILLPYLSNASEVAYYDDKDVGYIVLCDTSKYAVQFSAVRTILKALIWFGFIFYLLRELKVVISLNG